LAASAAYLGMANREEQGMKDVEAFAEQGRAAEMKDERRAIESLAFIHRWRAAALSDS
jgi:hypothetical protein